MPSKSQLDSFISASIYTTPVDVKKLKFIFSAIEEYAGAKNMKLEALCILEVACGSGGITLPLASLGCQVRAFDINEEAVKFLKKNADDKFENLTVTIDDGYTFNDKKFYDVIIVSEVLEHVLDPSRFIANVSQRMTVGSYLVVTIPNGYGPWELKNRIDPRTYLKKWDWLRRLLGKPPYVKGDGADHCQFYTWGQLTTLLSSFSLRAIRFEKSDSILAMFRPLRKSSLFGSIDIKLADVLPYWLASGWYSAFELEESGYYPKNLYQ